MPTAATAYTAWRAADILMSPLMMPFAAAILPLFRRLSRLLAISIAVIAAAVYYFILPPFFATPCLRFHYAAAELMLI